MAVADHPLGPFKDSGQPLIGKELPGGMKRGQNIDPDVFTDPVSGKTYLYWGNYYMAVCELNDDMVSVKPNTTKILIDNDRHYSEAPYVFYRDGYYYFTWSKNDTRSADYEVRYVRSKSPVGPIDPSESRMVVCKKPDQGFMPQATNPSCKCPARTNGTSSTTASSSPTASRWGVKRVITAKSAWTACFSMKTAQ